MKGFTTIHAGSARQALTRLRFIAQLSDAAREIPMPALSALVSEAVDIVVHCTRDTGVPRVTEVIAVEELLAPTAAASFTTTELFARPLRTDPLRWTGNVPVRAGRILEDAGHDLRAMLDTAPGSP